MKNKLFHWLDETFNDSYAVIHTGLPCFGGANGFNFIDHSDCDGHENFWKVLQLIDSLTFYENNSAFEISERGFEVTNQDTSTKCVIIPWDNHTYHTHLIGVKNGQY